MKKEIRIGETVNTEPTDYEKEFEPVEFANFGAVTDYPMTIEELKKIVTKAESGGANYVYINYHTDHNEYEFDFVSIK